MDITFMTNIIKDLGFPALVFCVWYIYHKDQIKTLRGMIQNMEERERRAQEFMKGLVESLHFMIGALSRIENKIDTNQMCPIVRKETHP